MLDLSFSEILLIVVVAVVFIGPKELPVVVRAVAKALRALKNLTTEVRRTFDDLADESGIRGDIKMIQGDDGKWYESYPVSSPLRGEIKRGALPEETTPTESAPTPALPPKGEGV